MSPESVVTFIISCAARTGSTMLVHLLRSNPAILCHGEVLTPEGIGPLMGHYRDRQQDSAFNTHLKNWRKNDLRSFIREVVFDPQGRHAVGFKFKTDEALSKAYDYPDALRIISSCEEIRVIHLHRRNLLAQFVSYKVVNEQTGITFIHKEEHRPSIRRFLIDLDEMCNYVRNVIARDFQASEAYRSHQSFAVAYEDMVARDPQFMARIQEFLCVPVMPLTTTTKKIIDGRLDYVVKNYEECQHALVAMKVYDLQKREIYR